MKNLNINISNRDIERLKLVSEYDIFCCSILKTIISTLEAQPDLEQSLLDSYGDCASIATDTEINKGTVDIVLTTPFKKE